MGQGPSTEGQSKDLSLCCPPAPPGKALLTKPLPLSPPLSTVPPVPGQPACWGERGSEGRVSPWQCGAHSGNLPLVPPALLGDPGPAGARQRASSHAEGCLGRSSLAGGPPSPLQPPSRAPLGTPGTRGQGQVSGVRPLWRGLRARGEARASRSPRASRALAILLTGPHVQRRRGQALGGVLLPPRPAEGSHPDGVSPSWKQGPVGRGGQGERNGTAVLPD